MFSKLKARPHTNLEMYRNRRQDAAVVFVHGFGSNSDVWGSFPKLLAGESRLSSWDIYAVSYATSKRWDFRIFAADPDLEKAALALQTHLEYGVLRRYKSIALIAHSMGGLIAQRVALANGMSKRLGHLFLFGTPSLGTKKAKYLTLAKNQIRDMSPGSVFLTQLRSDWATAFGVTLPFDLIAVVGQSDEFISAESILEPFPMSTRIAVPGDHGTMVKPQTADDLCVQVVVDVLCGSGHIQSTFDSAVVSIEQRQYQKVIDDFLPRAPLLDEATLIELSLALDAKKRSDEALNILEKFAHQSDAKGTLGGRYKKRWLTTGEGSDWRRAHKLYTEALNASIHSQDPNQILYHAINIAFLEAMEVPESSAIPASAREKAELALAAAKTARRDKWREATVGEAHLILGDLSGGLAAYKVALSLSATVRERGSMYSQAIAIVGRRFDDASVRRLNGLFGIVQ